MLPGWLGFVGCGKRLLEEVVRDVIVVIVLDQRCSELLAEAVTFLSVGYICTYVPSGGEFTA